MIYRCEFRVQDFEKEARMNEISFATRNLKLEILCGFAAL